MAKHVASLPTHASLLPCLDIVLAGGKINLLYPYRKQGSIKESMQKSNLAFLPEEEVMAYAVPILEALSCLHEAGFVHG